MRNAKGALVKTYGLRDIIGPIMVGPSSSHDGGGFGPRLHGAEALRRAARTRRLHPGTAPSPPPGSGHGTDKALVAGILELATPTTRAWPTPSPWRRQPACRWTSSGTRPPRWPHPNTVDIRCESREGRTLEMRGVSIRGRRGGHSAHQRHRRGHHRGTHERGRAPAR